jgi:hypothetical protein
MSDEQPVKLKPHGHAHGWYDPPCWPISEEVCLRPTVHGGAEHIRNADGTMAGGPTEHLSGFVVAHDRPGQRGEPRCEGAINVDPDLESKARWTMTGTLEGGDLTISPSILCGDGHHGFVRAGKWVPA